MVDAEGKPDIETPAYQVSVEKGQYTLVFPGKSFSQVPVLVVTPLGGATVLDIKREQREDAWLVQIQLSEQVPFSFIAVDPAGRAAAMTEEEKKAAELAQQEELKGR